MIVAFTGPVKPSCGMSTARFAIGAAVQGIHDAGVTELRTGAAYGVDTAAYFCGLATFRDTVTHTVMVPQGCKYNQDLVRHAKLEGHNVVAIKGGYLKRDDALVEGADLLLAFPNTETEVLRSGTWATIRRAWKRGVEVQMTPLDKLYKAVLALDL